MGKPKIATVWLEGCSGCHMSFLDLDEALVDILSKVELCDTPITDFKDFNFPDVDVGMNCRLSNAIVDKGCIIPDGTIIGEDPVADAKRFFVTPKGAVLVTPDMLGQEIHHAR